MVEQHIYNTGFILAVLNQYDYKLAGTYFSILVQFANARQTIAFCELVNLAKLKYGKKPELQKALNCATNRPIYIIRSYCELYELPDITQIVDAEYAENSSVTQANYPLESAFNYSWGLAARRFEQYLLAKSHALSDPKKLEKLLDEETALRLMKEFYEQHRDVLPDDIGQHRDKILEQLIRGKPVSDAYQEMME